MRLSKQAQLTTYFIVMIACLTVSSFAQLAGDYPTWRGSQTRNGQTEYIGTNTGRIAWTTQTDSYIASDPTIGPNGDIYFTSFDRNMYDVNTAGVVKWKYSSGETEYSTPSVGSDGTVYFGSGGGAMIAVNHDGTQKWRLSTNYHGIHPPVYSSPVIDTLGRLEYTDDIGVLRSVDSGTGSLLWQVSIPGAASRNVTIGDDGRTYVGTNSGTIYALGLDGHTAWTFNTGASISSAPVVAADGTIYFSSADHNLYALDHEGKFKWSQILYSQNGVCPAVGRDGTIYIGSMDGTINALNPDGTTKWTYYGYSPATSMIVDAANSVFYATMDGKFTSLDATGTRQWSLNTGYSIFTSPAMDRWGTIYVTGQEGALIAIGTPPDLTDTPEPGALALLGGCTVGMVGAAGRKRSRRG